MSTTVTTTQVNYNYLMNRSKHQLAEDFLAILDQQELTLKMLREANELLRSVHSIAKRRGESTNWDAFSVKLNGVLAEHHARGIVPDMPVVCQHCSGLNGQHTVDCTFGADFTEKK